MDELLDYHPFGTQRISWSSSSPSGKANAQKTIMDPNGSSWDRWSALGGLAIGAVLPGGGYGKLANKADDVGRAVIRAGRILDNVTVKSFGRTIYQGARDLKPTLDAISNKSISGKIYRNDPVNGSSLLPTKPSGYYTEYDAIDTPNWDYSKGRGPERVVTGQNGEQYYSSDHFKTIQNMD